MITRFSDKIPQVIKFDTVNKLIGVIHFFDPGTIVCYFIYKELEFYIETFDLTKESITTKCHQFNGTIEYEKLKENLSDKWFFRILVYLTPYINGSSKITNEFFAYISVFCYFLYIVVNILVYDIGRHIINTNIVNRLRNVVQKAIMPFFENHRNLSELITLLFFGFLDFFIIYKTFDYIVCINNEILFFCKNSSYPVNPERKMAF